MQLAAQRRHGARNAGQRMWASYLADGHVSARNVRGALRTFRAHGVNHSKGGWVGYRRDAHGRFAKLPWHRW